MQKKTYGTDRVARLIRYLLYGFCKKHSRKEPSKAKKFYWLVNNSNVTKFFSAEFEAKPLKIQCISFKNCQMQSQREKFPFFKYVFIN